MSFQFDPSLSSYVDDPYPVYKQLRDSWPAFYDERTNCWLITRYDDVIRVLQDHRTFSSAKGNAIIDSPLRVGRTLGSMDPPRHDALRRVVMQGVTRQRIDASIPPLRAHLRDVIDAIQAHRTCDVMADIGRPVLYGAMGRMLGLDKDAAVRGVALCETLFNAGTGPTGSPLTPEEFRAVFVFLEEQVEKRKADRGDDMISVLLNAKDDGANLSDQEIVANMTTVLLAGNASIGHFFTNLIYAFWRHPEQWQLLRADPSKIDAAVEEGLRWDTSTQCFARQTTADVEISGTKVPVGSRLIVFYGSANRDERVVPNPDQFDIDRGKVLHVGFGGGRHFCFGAATTKQMLRVIVEELLTVAEQYELDIAEARRIPHVMARGFSKLPMSW